jgi:hypothetical protein
MACDGDGYAQSELMPENIWTCGRTRTDRESKGLYKDLNTVTGIKKERTEWIGRHRRVVKKMFERKQEGIRIGRPRLRWLGDFLTI